LKTTKIYQPKGKLKAHSLKKNNGKNRGKLLEEKEKKKDKVRRPLREGRAGLQEKLLPHEVGGRVGIDKITEERLKPPPAREKKWRKGQPEGNSNVGKKGAQRRVPVE